MGVGICWATCNLLYLGFRIEGLGLGVIRKMLITHVLFVGLGFKAWGVWDSGFRVEGLGFALGSAEDLQHA